MNMREKIARALATANDQDPDEVIIRAPTAMLRWQAYERDSDAVLDAMREPTKEMLSACVNWSNECCQQFEPISIGYQRMIDAAKGEG